MRAFVPVAYKAPRRGLSISSMDVWKLLSCEVELDEIDGRDAPVVARCRDGKGTWRSGREALYRTFRGVVWEPSLKPNFGPRGTITPAAPGLIDDILSRISAHDIRQFWRGYDNGLVDWSSAPSSFAGHGETVEIDHDGSSPAARAALAGTLAVAGRTILIDGEPWRRSLGPFLTMSFYSDRPHPVLDWHSPADVAPRSHNMSGAIRADRHASVPALLAETYGVPEASLYSHHVEADILDATALAAAFDDVALSAEAYALRILWETRRHKLVELSSAQVTALADLRCRLTARAPGLYTSFGVDEDFAWRRPPEDAPVPPAGDLLDLIERVMDLFPRHKSLSFPVSRQIAAHLAAFGALPTPDLCDDDLAGFSI